MIVDTTKIDLLKLKMKAAPNGVSAEILYHRGKNGMQAFGVGLRDDAGKIVRVFQLTDPALNGLLNKPDAFDIHREDTTLRGITLKHKNKKPLWNTYRNGETLDKDTVIAAMTRTKPTRPDFDAFKNNYYLSLHPLRYETQVGRKKTVMQGYALMDDKTGQMLRYVSQEWMDQKFAEIGATKIRIGKNGNITRIDTTPGKWITQKNLIDHMVGVDRQKTAAEKKSEAKRKVVQELGIGGALSVAGATAALTVLSPMIFPDAKLSDQFNAQASQKYEIKTIKRAPDHDPAAAWKSIKDPEIKKSLEGWFLKGTYADYVEQTMANDTIILQSENPAEIAKLEAVNKDLSYKMMWPTQTARAVDDMWASDQKSLKQLGFKSAGEVYQYALAFAHRESYFGKELTNPDNPTVLGLYHFNIDTFKATVKNYAKNDYGRGTVLPRSDDAVRTMMLDPYFTTKMLLQHTKDNYLGQSNNPNEFYETHVLGAGGQHMLATHKDAIAANMLKAAASENTSVFYKDNGEPRTGKQVLAILHRRYMNSVGAVKNMGFLTMEDGVEDFCKGKKTAGHFEKTALLSADTGDDDAPNVTRIALLDTQPVGKAVTLSALLNTTSPIIMPSGSLAGKFEASAKALDFSSKGSSPLAVSFAENRRSAPPPAPAGLQ